MIKCNRCGNMNTAGAVRCQSCGSALSSMDTSGNSSNTTSQEQSALPAWLESLRVGERAPRPTSDSPKFSTADLIEEGSLPSWMHVQRNETQNVTGANMPVSLRSSSLPAPSTDGTPFPAPGFAAQSLIDEQSLPSWMQEGEASTSLPPQGGIPAAMSPQSGMPAANLVDQKSMPDWMKSLQQGSSAVTGLGQPAQIPSTESEVKKIDSVLTPPPFGSGFVARDLVDQQSLPDWMTQLGNQNPATSVSHEPLMQQPESFSRPVVHEPQRPIQPGQKGFAARDLIDQQSLPAWMLPQNGQNSVASSNSGQEKQSNQPVTGLPASSLLDMNALPSWLAGNGQPQAVYSQPPAPMASSNQSWPPQEPAMQRSATDFSSGQGGHIAASSVIDMNALPEWLRSAGGQQSAPYMSPQSSSASYAGPPRVESVQVPSRPRGEVSSSETSEMAASVFASMLGVASTTPKFPPPPSNPYQQPSGQVSYGEQMSLSGVSGMASMPSQAGISMLGVGNPGGASMIGGPVGQSVAGMPGRPGGQSMTGIPGGSGIHSMAGMPGGLWAQSMPGGPGSQSMGGIPGGSGIHSMAGMPGGPGSQSMGGIPGGSGIHSMAGMPGGPGGQSMGGIPGGSGIHSMAGMPGGPGSQSMKGIPGVTNTYSMAGGNGGQSMVGNAYGNPAGPSRLGTAGDDKNTKKRGLFGALLDWLSR